MRQNPFSEALVMVSSRMSLVVGLRFESGSSVTFYIHMLALVSLGLCDSNVIIHPICTGLVGSLQTTCMSHNTLRSSWWQSTVNHKWPTSAFQCLVHTSTIDSLLVLLRLDLVYMV